jgi:hypothetical protein
VGVEKIINRATMRFNPAHPLSIPSFDIELPMFPLRVVRCLILCLLSCCLGGSASAGNWPDFRGPNGDGRAATARLPLSWSETENVKWKVDLPGRGWWTPVA